MSDKMELKEVNGAIEKCGEARKLNSAPFEKLTFELAEGHFLRGNCWNSEKER